MDQNHKDALVHGLKVLAWVVGSAVVPALASLWSGNPTWLAAAPIINFVAAYLVKYSELGKSNPQ